MLHVATRWRTPWCELLCSTLAAAGLEVVIRFFFMSWRSWTICGNCVWGRACTEAHAANDTAKRLMDRCMEDFGSTARVGEGYRCARQESSGATAEQTDLKVAAERERHRHIFFSVWCPRGSNTLMNVSLERGCSSETVRKFSPKSDNQCPGGVGWGRSGSSLSFENVTS